MGGFFTVFYQDFESRDRYFESDTYIKILKIISHDLSYNKKEKTKLRILNGKNHKKIVLTT